MLASSFQIRSRQIVEKLIKSFRLNNFQIFNNMEKSGHFEESNFVTNNNICEVTSGKLIPNCSISTDKFTAAKTEKESQDSNQPPSTSAGGVLSDEKEELTDEELCLRWKKPTESMFLVQQLVRKGIQPRRILNLLYPMYSIPADIPDQWILQLLRELCEHKTREKLPEWNTFGDAVQLFRKSKRILIITGAGVSVSCGIPDFRSANGIYARLHKDFPELPDPHAMFDIDFFRHNPAPFYNFAKEIFPGQFRPSISHMFIKFLEEEGKLLRNYTQNIDTLERITGICNLVECHGSFARSTCLNCKHEIDSEQIREEIFAQRIPHCQKCKLGVMKPNIVFFGEDLGDSFHVQMGEDHQNLDLLVVIGSSMQVRPVSLIPYNIQPEVPQVLINKELLPNYPADIKLLGNCDAILAQLALAIGGGMREKMIKELASRQAITDAILSMELFEKIKKMPPDGTYSPSQIDMEHFKRRVGAEEADDVLGEPDVKKAKVATGGEQMNQASQEDKATSNIWEGNYVLVESNLPTKDSTLLVPPNINVFTGAELYYDKDQDIFVRRAGVSQRYEEDEFDNEFRCAQSDGSSSSSETDSSDTSGCTERCNSLPTQLERSRTNDVRKAESCPPQATSFGTETGKDDTNRN